MSDFQPLDHLITRHSRYDDKSGASTEYPGLSNEGVDLAHERAREIVQYISHTAEGSVIWMAGSSFVPRARSTLRIYAEDVATALSRDPHTIVWRWKKPRAKNLAEALAALKRQREEAMQFIQDNPTKRVVIDFPLPLEEFLTPALHTDKRSGHWGPELDTLYQQARGDINETFRLWFERHQQGNVAGPEQALSSLQRGMRALEDTAKQYVSEGRPVLIISVGHSTELNALAAQREKEGGRTFQPAANSVSETEPFVITQQPDGARTVLFRGDEYSLNEIV